MWSNIETDYFTKVLEDDLKAVVKPQYVDQIPKAIKGPDKSVGKLIEGRSQMDNLEEICDALGILPMQSWVTTLANVRQS